MAETAPEVGVCGVPVEPCNKFSFSNCFSAFTAALEKSSADSGVSGGGGSVLVLFPLAHSRQIQNADEIGKINWIIVVFLHQLNF